jgi:hypothetical protein
MECIAFPCLRSETWGTRPPAYPEIALVETFAREETTTTDQTA